MLRAVDEEDRQERRKIILEAARNLFSHGEGRLPTASEIAVAAGLAKGTLYLYFKTKEEIFANVLLEGWLPLLSFTQRMSVAPNKREQARQVQLFLQAALEHFQQHPELLRLDTLSAGVLEKNMAPEALLEYKRRFNQGLLEAGTRIDKVLGLVSGRGVQILLRTYALTRGLWQTAEHWEVLAAAGIPLEAKHSGKDFFEDLSEALNEYWRGALLR